MPPVFGPAVAVEDPLVVLGRGERQRSHAVADRQQRDLGADQVLLDDHALGAEAVLDQQLARGPARASARRRR